jgi:hypothetical protein
MSDNKFIGVWTLGMMCLSSDIREAVERKFLRESKVVDDWFYAVEVDGQKYFIAENGEFGYTAMLPSEY